MRPQFMGNVNTDLMKVTEVQGPLRSLNRFLQHHKRILGQIKGRRKSSCVINPNILDILIPAFNQMRLT